MSVEDRIESELQDLKRIRDELRVRIHLGKAEAKELWEKSEEKIEAVEAKVRSVRKQAEQPLDNVRDAARLLLDEIRDGFERIRAAL
jgi:F0F1-type ATP synthase membrane subunit b/b'